MRHLGHLGAPGSPRGTFRLGEEHGSSRWGSIEEGKAFMNQDEPDLNIPLTSSIGTPVSRSDFDLETDRNRNICVVGTPGTGKTRSHVLPLLMQMNASYPGPTRRERS